MEPKTEKQRSQDRRSKQIRVRADSSSEDEKSKNSRYWHRTPQGDVGDNQKGKEASREATPMGVACRSQKQIFRI